MEGQWLAWAKRLQALASTGLYFTDAEHDRERYAEVAEIANAMLAGLGDVPIDRIAELVPDFAQGYATPLIDVRGAVFSGNQILLVRERADGFWTMPGGYADVGLSAAQNVEKEISEEAGLEVKARRLYCVRHKAKHAYRPDIRDFYKMFFICESLGEAPPVPGIETTEVAYFDTDALPELSRGRTIAADVAEAVAHRDDPRRSVVFD